MRAVTADQRSHSESFITDALVFCEYVSRDIESDWTSECGWDGSAVRETISGAGCRSSAESFLTGKQRTVRRKESTDPLLKDLQRSHFSSWHHRVTTLTVKHTHTSESCFIWQPWTKPVVHVRLQVDRAETLTAYSSSARWLVPPLQKDLFTAVHCCTKLNVLFVGVASSSTYF